MTNPKVIQIAQIIGEAVPQLFIDREQNVVTLEDGDGERYLVTVERVFHDTREVVVPLPGLDDEA